jgi:hypothetical protein
MLSKPSTSITAAALAITVALQASVASARCDSTFNLPMGINSRECLDRDGSGDLAEGIAFDSSGNRGEKYSYDIELLSGSLATGLLLDASGDLVVAQDGGSCPLVLDFFADDGVNDSDFCEVRVANSAAAFQVVAE